MADDTVTHVTSDAAQPVEEPTRSEDAVAEPAVAESKPDEGGVVATDGVAEVPQNNHAVEEPEVKEGGAADAQAASGDADAAPSSDAPATNGTPGPKKASNGKRKSGVGAADKKKTPAKSKKKAPELRLNVSAGEMYMVAMRGFQPWPVIVCDEEMLPESLLSKRPVSAKRIDGTYREDFLEGGKNAKDRRYPIMFLGTNEFAWQVNTELLPFDLEEVKKEVETGSQGKKNKSLWHAYQVAAEGHDLAHFKAVLASHEEALQQDAELREQKEQEKKEKSEKSAKRKSTAGTSDDVEMDDAGDDAGPKKAKSSKKRKKGEESDGENEKPAKTPKTKLKLTTKTPKDASAAKPKKEPKAKKKASEEAEPVPVEEQLTEEEKLQKREKQILYLRHRLQKGFLARDQAPKDEDMALMSDYLKQLEVHDDLEAEVIKKTKVHKVLKAIIKLNHIPKEEEYGFKGRSNDLLTKWGGALAADTETAAVPPQASNEEATTNGVKHEDDEKKSAEPDRENAPSESKDAPKEDADAAPAASTKLDKDGDVSMGDSDKDHKTQAPTASTDDESKVKDPIEAPSNSEATAPAADVSVP